MSVSYKVIGRHIQEARKRMKLTQREIAEKLISVLLNVPLEDLISGCMENAVPSNADNPQKLSLASQFSEIAYGCSEKSRNLMLRVCRDIAQADRE